MKHIRLVNRRRRAQAESLIDFGCTTLFEPGWEVGNDMGHMGLCRPVYRDLGGCAGDCWWPAQVPDDLTSYPSWMEACGAIERDWAEIEFVK